MKSHKNVRTAFAGCKLLIERIRTMGPTLAAEAAGISPRTARKWLGRFETQGEAGQMDRSARPCRTCSMIDDVLRRRIEQLRCRCMPMRTMAYTVGRSVASVSRPLAAPGLSSLKALEPKEPVLRYEHQAPGKLLHMEMKKLGHIVAPGHRITGKPRDPTRGAG